MYVILWEFRVRPGCESAFERAYGPAGDDWARLFHRVEGYVDTRLLVDPEEAGRYVTVDRWTSLEAYATFRERLREEYEALDGSFDELTEDERRLGAFLDLEGPGPA